MVRTHLRSLAKDLVNTMPLLNLHTEPRTGVQKQKLLADGARLVVRSVVVREVAGSNPVVRPLQVRFS